MKKAREGNVLLMFALMSVGTVMPAYAQPNSSKQAAPLPASSDKCPEQFDALNNDKQISQREEAQIRTSVFSALDKDKNDVVSREEYVQCLASTPAFLIAGVAGLGGRPDATGLLNRSASRFQMVDTSRDGKISWDEYMDASSADLKRFGKAAGRDSADGSAVAGWAFARMDADLSGEITRDEWGGDAGFAQLRDGSFELMDVNRDKGLDRTEFEKRSKGR